MKLWVFREPDERIFAPASGIGTWVEVGSPPQSARVQPLVIVWEPGPTLVGDFTWLGSGGYMVKRSVGEDLIAAGFKGFELGRVEMVVNPYHKEKKQGIVKLPYEGPELADFYVTKSVPLDRERSTLRCTKGEDGEPTFELEGIETVEHGDWHPDTGVLDRFHIPRTPGMGLFVNAKDLGDCDVFKVDGLPAGIRCTDRMRDFIINNGYTNITFFEVGETID
jgi:hypothetical protein